MTETSSATTPSYKASNSLKRRLAIAQLISSQLTFKIALRFFFSPIRFPTPERELSIKQSGILSREIVNNKRITIYQYGKSTKTVLLVHGWSGRASQFYALTPELEKAGYKVLSFTAPAHGSSEDEETNMLEFADCIKFLDVMYGPFDALIGHSLGGMAILNAIEQGVKTNKVVFLGVPGYIKDVVADFCNRLGLNKKVEQKLLNHLSAQYGGDIEVFSTTRLAAKMDIPGLIIHDVDDRDVAIEFARQNHKVWPKSKLVETNGLGHRLILSDANVIKKIKEFILN
jgi:pimeloyl-ACP methyl ester carboxylesterase